MKKKGKWLLSMALMVSLAVPVSAAPVNLQDVSAVEASADTAADEQSAETGVSSIEESAVGTEMTESAVGTETTESAVGTETTESTEIPETKETEPETKKTEPETKETEPETKETEDNTKTDHELIGEMTKASVSLKSAKCQAFNTIKVEWQAAAGADADGYVIYKKTENSNW